MSGPGTHPNRTFWWLIALLSGGYLTFLISLLLADCFFTTPQSILESVQSAEIRYAMKLTLISCTLATILSLWIAVPMGYLLSRQKFFGKNLVEAIIDIPLVLPPLVIGLSLLIFFQTQPGKQLEWLARNRLGTIFIQLLIPAIIFFLMMMMRSPRTSNRRKTHAVIAALSVAVGLQVLPQTDLAAQYLNRSLSTSITYAVPSIIIAQFAVSSAFAIRTMRVTFDQISKREEEIAFTFGCTRFQAFWYIALPRAKNGLATAAALAWARALGEFGPILIFAGATRMRTEVLSTSVFLELSIGNIQAAIAIALIMIFIAFLVLTFTRILGFRENNIL